MVEEGGEIDIQTDQIIIVLNQLIESKKYRTEEITDEMLAKFENVQIVIRTLGFALTLAGYSYCLLNYTDHCFPQFESCD